MASFSQGIKQYIEELKEVKVNLISSYQDTLYDIGDKLVYYTPLKTGLASSNWSVGVLGYIENEREVIAGLKGAASLNSMKEQVKQLDGTVTVEYSNPVEYIDDLERGSSQQAPAGMITPTRVLIDDLWIKNLKKYKLVE